MTWLGTTISTIRTPPTLPWGKTSVYFVFPLPWEMFYISLNSEICKLWTCFFLCKIYIINTWVNEEDEGKEPLHLLFCTQNCHPLLHPWHSCLLGVHRSFSETGCASVISVPAPKSHSRSPLWVAFHHPSAITAAATSHSYTRSWRRQSWGCSSLSCEFSPHNPAFSLMVSLIRTKHLF